LTLAPDGAATDVVPSRDLQVADAGSIPWAAGAVDLIVCSPPYGIGVPYADGGDVDPGAYWSLAAVWAAEMRRVVRRDGGRLALNIALDTTWSTTFYAEWVRVLLGAGWTVKHNITWNESNISRRTAWGSWLLPSAPHILNPTEMIVVCHLGDYRRPALGRPGDILPDEQKDWSLGLWSFAGANAKLIGHPAPYPEELPRRLIKLYTYPGDVVADPFVGSGTTAVVAAKLGRRVLGIDRSPTYVSAARARLASVLAARRDTDLSRVA
jgi:site-specific DNA-methyltransferase (adenine-specific)